MQNNAIHIIERHRPKDEQSEANERESEEGKEVEGKKQKSFLAGKNMREPRHPLVNHRRYGCAGPCNLVCLRSTPTPSASPIPQAQP